jgi:1,4-dihydroxy-2-naphthoyl-CoA synthase
MAYENIIVETKGRVGVIRLNRPQALNALNRALIEELKQAIDAFEADDKIGCLVITGSEGLRCRRRYQGNGRQDVYRGLSRQFRRQSTLYIAGA